MWPVGSFNEMINALNARETIKGTDIPITVGILIADCRRAFLRENIFNYIEDLDKNTGPLIDFYIPGYSKISLFDKDEYRMYSDMYELKGNKYAFSPSIFSEFINALNAQGIGVSKEGQLLLFNYKNVSPNSSNHYVDIEKIVRYNLEADYRKGKLDSVDKVFDTIIETSKKTTEFEVFKKSQNKAKTVDYIKKHLPGAVVSFVRGKLKVIFN